MTRTARRATRAWKRSATAGALAAVLSIPMAGLAVSPASAAPSREADTGAKITNETRVGENQIDITIDSPSLDRSVKTRIILPASWQPDASRTWPVLYAFHGGQDGYISWPRSTEIEQWAAAYDVMVVMPEGANGSHTNWFNYGKGGTPKWETFHTKEVFQLVQRNYHAGTTRAAIGNSSGGQGAFTYAARHPGMFKHVASLSGILSMRSPGIPSMLMMTNLGNGLDPYAIWGIPWADDANWKAHDPAYLAPKLAGTKLFFSSGTTGRPGPGDPDVAPWDIGLLSEIVVGENNKTFRKRLDELGIPYTAHIYGDGRHNWPAWIREAQWVWPKLMDSIGAQKL